MCRIVGAPPFCAPARVLLSRTLVEGEGRVGYRPPLKLKVRPFSAGGGPLECLFPYLQKPSQCNAFAALPYSSGRLRHRRFYALGAWICGLLHPRGNLNPARAIPASHPLSAMGFRLRRSARLGPLRFNFSSGGLSSISVGGRGASFNIR